MERSRRCCETILLAGKQQEDTASPLLAKQAVEVTRPKRSVLAAPHKRRGPEARRLGPEAWELLSIRHSLGLTQADFALACGVDREKIVNIENGRVRTVPPELLATARRLHDEEREARVVPLADLRRLSMPEILNRWWQLLGIEDDQEGAILLGASAFTIRRWREGEGRPSDSDLLRYELIVRKRLQAMGRLPQPVGDP